MTEQQAVEQLADYKRVVARIRVLESYSVGAGITVSRLNEDDQLQELHRKLRGMPSYMYLTKPEQRLEATAHAYLTRYPAGTKAQLAEIPLRGADGEDDKLLCELRRKIERVIEARTGHRDDIDAILERLAELQDLQAQKRQIDNALGALAEYKPEYAKLLRVHYLEGKPWSDAAKELRISKDVFYRWRKKAVAEYEKIAN